MGRFSKILVYGLQGVKFSITSISYNILFIKNTGLSYYIQAYVEGLQGRLPPGEMDDK